MYASVKLVTKNNAANTAVNFENNVAVPRAPKTVPEAPEPNPAPASAPFPRCMSDLSMSRGSRRAYLKKLIGAQRRAAHQTAVHIAHREQLRRIRCLDAAAVQNADTTS